MFEALEVLEVLQVIFGDIEIKNENIY